MKFAKYGLPWLLAVAALAGAYLLYTAGAVKETELAKLRADAQEVEKLRAENTELQAGAAQGAELARLRKDNEDLIRLRGEVQLLRGQTQQFSNQLRQAKTALGSQPELQQREQIIQLQAELRQLRAQLGQQPQTPQTPQAPQTTPPPTTEEKATMCIINLRQIDAAKQQWTLQNQKPFTTPVTPEDILPYLKDNVFPSCPVGGAYSVNAVGVNPTCTLPSHVYR